MITDFLITQILAAKSKSDTAPVAILDRKIDQSFYKLYGLMADELNLVKEPTTKGDPITQWQMAHIASNHIAC